MFHIFGILVRSSEKTYQTNQIDSVQYNPNHKVQKTNLEIEFDEIFKNQLSSYQLHFVIF